MRQYNEQKTERIKSLVELFFALLEKRDPVGAIHACQHHIDHTSAEEVIDVVDRLVRQDVPMEHLKTGVNKFMNVLYKTLEAAPAITPPEGSFLYYCLANNAELDKKLKSIKPWVRKINDFPSQSDTRNTIRLAVEELLLYDQYYILKENVLFPLLEKNWKDFRCLSVMWSFHDDIRNSLKNILKLLTGNDFSIESFNENIGEAFFSMYAIKFREEKILFPVIMKTIPEDELDTLLEQCQEPGFPYHNPPAKGISTGLPGERGNNLLGALGEGEASTELISLIFDHLPVDITYVDEHNKVKYYSQPVKRIFPRSRSVIGRDVRNCHPPESVHVVEEIIDAFRSGKKDKARFWIQVKDEFILIEYFALRDSERNYRGVIEVTQEVSEIINLKGERRLLQWSD